MDAGARSRPMRETRKRKIKYTDDQDPDVSDHHPSSPKKRSKNAQKVPDVGNLTTDSTKKTPSKKGKQATDVPTEEKRLRQFRARAPQSYKAIKDRALTQRLTVLSRERNGTDEEIVRCAGSTGNVYTITIGMMPSCDCPHAKKGNQCKHIVYIMLRVLKAPEHIAYQLALTTSELRDLLQNAPPIPGIETNSLDKTEQQGEDPNRKPIEGECPICYDEMHSNEALVYCKTSCGNNMHKDCMQKWLAASGRKATCPYCRGIWSDLEGMMGNVDVTGLRKNEEGYVNVAGQLGLSGERDCSSYHPFWVRKQFRRFED